MGDNVGGKHHRWGRQRVCGELGAGRGSRGGGHSGAVLVEGHFLVEQGDEGEEEEEQPAEVVDGLERDPLG